MNQLNRSQFKRLIFKKLAFSAGAPLILFYIFKYFGMQFIGIVVAGSWSVGVFIINLSIERKFDYIAMLTAIFSAIGLIGTIISKNLFYYLISPIISDLIWAAIFLASLLFHKPLMQMIVEEILPLPETIKCTETYRKTWVILSAVWGLYNLVLGIFTAILLRSVSVSVYFSVITLCGNILLIILIAFNFWFTRWYWRKTHLIGSDVSSFNDNKADSEDFGQ